MNLSEFNILLTIFWLLIFTFIFGFENTFKSLIISEFLWITLFCFYLISALIYDDFNLLALTLFFLIFSAIEISVCLVIIILQKKLFKTLNTFTNSSKLFLSTVSKFKNITNFKYKY